MVLRQGSYDLSRNHVSAKPVSHLACVEKLEADRDAARDELAMCFHDKDAAEQRLMQGEQEPSFLGNTAVWHDRALQAEREAAFWKWLATHEYRCPLGEMNPGEEGSYLVEVTYTVEFLAHMRERWEREARP
jgi:hypothetical protein